MPFLALITRLEESEGMVGSLHDSLSTLEPSGSALKDMSSPRSITWGVGEDLERTPLPTPLCAHMEERGQVMVSVLTPPHNAEEQVDLWW